MLSQIHLTFSMEKIYFFFEIYLHFSIYLILYRKVYTFSIIIRF